MNQQQVKYALGRLESARRTNEQALLNKHTVPEKKLTTHDVWRLLNAGSLQLRKLKDVKNTDLWHSDQYISRFFDLSDFQSPSYLSEEGKAAISKMNTRAAALSDQLVLGDASEALSLINAFSQEYALYTAAHC